MPRLPNMAFTHVGKLQSGAQVIWVVRNSIGTAFLKKVDTSRACSGLERRATRVDKWS